MTWKRRENRSSMCLLFVIKNHFNAFVIIKYHVNFSHNWYCKCLVPIVQMREIEIELQCYLLIHLWCCLLFPLQWFYDFDSRSSKKSAHLTGIILQIYWLVGIWMDCVDMTYHRTQRMRLGCFWGYAPSLRKFKFSIRRKISSNFSGFYFYSQKTFSSSNRKILMLKVRKSSLPWHTYTPKLRRQF